MQETINHHVVRIILFLSPKEEDSSDTLLKSLQQRRPIKKTGGCTRQRPRSLLIHNVRKSRSYPYVSQIQVSSAGSQYTTHTGKKPLCFGAFLITMVGTHKILKEDIVVPTLHCSMVFFIFFAPFLAVCVFFLYIILLLR